MKISDFSDSLQYNDFISEMRRFSRKRRHKVVNEIPTYVMDMTNKQPVYLPVSEQYSVPLYSLGSEPANEDQEKAKRPKMKARKKPIEVIVISDDEEEYISFEDEEFLPSIQVPRLDLEHLKHLSTIHKISNFTEIFKKLFEYERVNIINHNMKNFQSIKNIRETQNLMPDVRSLTLRPDQYKKFIKDNYARETNFPRNTTFEFNLYPVKNTKIKTPLSSIEQIHSEIEDLHNIQQMIDPQVQAETVQPINTQPESNNAHTNYASPQPNPYQQPSPNYFNTNAEPANLYQQNIDVIPPVINTQPEINPQPSTSNANPQPSTSYANPQPSTSYANPQPSTSNTNPQPSTSSAKEPNSGTTPDTDSETEIKARLPPKKRKRKNNKNAALLNLAKIIIENTNTNVSCPSACMLTPPNSISGDSQQIDNIEDGNTAIMRSVIANSAASHNFFDSYDFESLMPSTSWMYGTYSPFGQSAVTYNMQL